MDATTALVLIYRQAYIKLLQRITKRAQAGKSITYDAATARDVRKILDELDEARDAGQKPKWPGRDE